MFALLFSLKGRIGRSTYFVTSISAGLIYGFIVGFMSGALRYNPSLPLSLAIMVITVLAIWMQFALAVKRCHDVGMSGLYVAAVFAFDIAIRMGLAANAHNKSAAAFSMVWTVLSIGVCLIVASLPGQAKDNVWGTVSGEVKPIDIGQPWIGEPERPDYNAVAWQAVQDADQQIKQVADRLAAVDPRLADGLARWVLKSHGQEAIDEFVHEIRLGHVNDVMAADRLRAVEERFGEIDYVMETRSGAIAVLKNRRAVVFKPGDSQVFEDISAYASQAKGAEGVGWSRIDLAAERGRICAKISGPEFQFKAWARKKPAVTASAGLDERARWLAMLNQYPQLLAAARQIDGLGERYLIELAQWALVPAEKPWLERDGDRSWLQQTVESILKGGTGDYAVERCIGQIRDRWGAINYVLTTPWGGIVVTQNGPAVLYKDGRCEVLSDISEYHMKYKREDTATWKSFNAEKAILEELRSLVQQGFDPSRCIA